MVDALATAPGIETIGAAGGLHLTILLPPNADDRAVAAALLADGIDVPPLSRYRLTSGPPGLVASFAAADERQAREFVRSLQDVLGSDPRT